MDYTVRQCCQIIRNVAGRKSGLRKLCPMVTMSLKPLGSSGKFGLGGAYEVPSVLTESVKADDGYRPRS